MTPLIRRRWCCAWMLMWFVAPAIAWGAAAPSTHDGFEAVFNNEVCALHVQNDGKIMVGGLFTSFGGATKRYFIRLLPDGTQDMSFNPGSGPNGSVSAICLQNNGKYMIGGRFSKFDTTTSLYVARLNVDGSLDRTFRSNLVTTSSGGVTAMIMQPDGRVVAGGRFGNSTWPRMARINDDGQVDVSFVPVLRANISIFTMAQQRDGKILAGGVIYIPEPESRTPFITRLNADGSADDTFIQYEPDFQGGVDNLIVQPDGKILVGYDTGSVYEQRFMRLNADGSPDAEFPVRDGALIMQQPDGKIYSQYNKDFVYQFQRWNRDGSPDPTLISSRGYSDLARTGAIQPDGKLLISIGNYDSGRILRLYQNGSADADFNPEMIPNGTIHKITVQPDRKMVIGGAFNWINGISRNNVARLNADGSLDRSFDPGGGANGAVKDAVLQPDGKILLTGDFQQYDGHSLPIYSGFARANPDGSYDRFFPHINTNDVHFVAQPDGNILAYGPFSTVNSSTRKGVARLLNNGLTDLSFNPGTACDPGDIDSVILLPDGKLMVAGEFTNFSGVARNSLARLTTSGTLDMDFNATIGYTTKMVAQSDGKLIIVTVRPGTVANHVHRVSRLDADGSIDDGFTTYTTTGFNYMTGISKIICQPDDKILIAASDDLRWNVRRLNADGTVDSDFYSGQGANGRIVDLATRDDGKIIVCGDFTVIFGEERCRIALLNADGTLDMSPTFLSTGPDGEVNALATYGDDSILIGGSITSMNGYACKGLGHLNTEGWLDTTHTTQATRVAAAATLLDGKSYICDQPSTGPLRIVTRRNSNGTTDTAFKPVVIDGPVSCMLTPPNGGLIVAGAFHSVSGVTRHQIARLDDIGSVTLPFDCGDAMDLGELNYIESDLPDWPDELIVEHRGRINSIVMQGGKLIVGGLFDRVARVDRRCVARLFINGVLDTTFNPGAGPDGEVLSVLVQLDGKILIAGEFVNVDGVPRHGIARLNPDGSLDATFVPDTAEWNYFNSMALQSDGKIIVGGFYNSGDIFGRVARLNPDGTLDRLFENQSWDKINFAGVNGIALQSDGKLLVAGLFNTFGALPRHNLARISNPDASLDRLEVAPAGAAVTWRFGGSHPQPYAVLFEESSDGAAWNELGWGTPVPGVGFRIGHLSLPIEQSHFVRATGWNTSGQNNGSVSVHQSTLWFVTSDYNAVMNWAVYE